MSDREPKEAARIREAGAGHYAGFFISIGGGGAMCCPTSKTPEVTKSLFNIGAGAENLKSFCNVAFDTW
jgi:hypothetical protein